MWEPILAGDTAERARDTVLAIARALASPDAPPINATDAALFWAYVAGAFDDAWITERYEAAIDALVDHATAGFRDLSLHGGAAGVGFAIAHVSEPGSAEDSLVAIDTLIDTTLAQTRWDGYDLITGLVGIGVYLLERGDAASAQQALARVIEQLLACAENTPDGIAWFTPKESMPVRQHPTWPDGQFNCGLAHGVPGVIALLGRAAERDPHVRSTALEALRWLGAQRLDDGRYPSATARTRRTLGPARTAWCYGDPGIALATWSATGRLGLPTTDALALARLAATRPRDATGVVDAGFCHGAAGLAHVFNRFYQASHDNVFLDAARRWFDVALAMRRDDGFGGYLAWGSPMDVVPTSWHPDPNLVEGVIGIGLALLAAIDPTAPSWDRIMLCEL